MAKFQVIKNGKLLTFSRYEDIPKSFDNLVSFQPDETPGPHTPEQHDEMASWLPKFQEILKRERRR